MALKVGRMVVFTALATAAGHVLACRCSQTPPQSYAFSFGISSLFPSFLIGRGQGRVFCVCFMKVRFVARRREEEVGFDGLCCCKLLTQSDLYKNY